MKLFMNIKFTDKIDLCRDVKRIAFSDLNIYLLCMEEYKFKEQHGTKNLHYLMDLILCHIFKIILNISSRSMTHSVINHLFKYMSTKLNIELYLKLKLDTIFNF